VSIAVAGDYADIFDGPLYERSPGAEEVLRPLLPSLPDIAAEVRAHLHRSVDGVEIVKAPGARNVVIETRPDVCEVFKRRGMFARLLVGHPAGYASGCVDLMRGEALALARKMAERIVEHVVDLRAERAVHRSAFAEPRLEPILVHVHEPLPCILGDNTGHPLFFIDHHTDSLGVIYAAWYFVTPAGVQFKETPCHRP
jgi:hypothetical protein